MRRLVAIVLACAIAIAFAALRSPYPSQATDTYRFDAIFDTAKGVLPGQVVKIAGAQVGTIEDVSLTPDYRARISMSIDARFAPFRSDARCEIQPEAIVSENFVQCEPGSPEGEELVGIDGFPPTVQVERTAVPVNFTDLFEIWQTPTRQRLSVVVATLGIGLAARGEDVNEILRRSNPALELAQEAIGTLADQRRELAQITDASNHIVGELARRSGRIEDFIDGGAEVTGRLAERSTDLQETIRRLPELLDAAEPALEQLDELSAEAEPILTDLEASGPALDRLLASAIAAAEPGRPALDRLSAAVDQGLDAIDAAGPLVGVVRTFAAEALPTGQSLGELFVNLRERGFVEGTLSYVYNLAAATARYDNTAHLAPLLLTGNECSLANAQRTENCNAGWVDPSAEGESATAGEPDGGTVPISAPGRARDRRPPAAGRPAREQPDTPVGGEPPAGQGGGLLPGLPLLPELGEPQPENGSNGGGINNLLKPLDPLLDLLFG